MRRQAVGAAALVVTSLSLVALVLRPPPAAALVTGVSPTSRTVVPGEAASAIVRVQTDSVSCLRVTASGPGVSASVSPTCVNPGQSSALTVSSGGDTPDGSYTVRVDDAE